MPDSLPEQPQLQRFTHKVHGTEFIAGLERGMIFWVHVTRNETVDSEHYHQDTPCPWVVLSSKAIHGRMPLVIVAPLTSQTHKADSDHFRAHRIRVLASKRQDFRVHDEKLALRGDSLVLTEQVRVFAHSRLEGNPVSQLSFEALAAVETGLQHVLELDVMSTPVG